MPAKNYPSDLENGIDSRDANTESGYVSGGSSDDYVPEIVFTKPHLQFLNRQLQFLEPQGMFDIAFSSNLEPRFRRKIRI
jgi:phosphoadenosine phosphosulfate reductase